MLELIARPGVEPYEGSVRFAQTMRDHELSRAAFPRAPTAATWWWPVTLLAAAERAMLGQRTDRNRLRHS